MASPDIIANRPPDVEEVHIIWMTTGLSCDGDSVSVTAATLPSVEEVVLGAIPGLLIRFLRSGRHLAAPGALCTLGGP